MSIQFLFVILFLFDPTLVSVCFLVDVMCWQWQLEPLFYKK